MDFHTEGRSPPAKRFFTLTSVICRERLWKSRTFPHRFFQRSMNLVFCLFLYYMLKLCFSEYYLYISTVWLLHHKTLNLKVHCQINNIFKRECKKWCTHVFATSKFHFLSTNLHITLFFSNAIKAPV